jgi:DNA-binding NarL/FixJ family response regulator
MTKSVFSFIPSPIASDVSERGALSKRETEIADLLAKGYSYKEICAELSIQIGTVQTHVVSVYRKLGARCRMDVVNLAIRARCSFLEGGECPLASRLKRRRIRRD